MGPALPTSFSSECLPNKFKSDAKPLLTVLAETAKLTTCVTGKAQVTKTLRVLLRVLKFGFRVYSALGALEDSPFQVSGTYVHDKSPKEHGRSGLNSSSLKFLPGELAPALIIILVAMNKTITGIDIPISGSPIHTTRGVLTELYRISLWGMT